MNNYPQKQKTEETVAFGESAAVYLYCVPVDFGCLSADEKEAQKPNSKTKLLLFVKTAATNGMSKKHKSPSFTKGSYAFIVVFVY